MTAPLAALFRVRDALASVRSDLTNLFTLQLGDVLTDVPESAEAELWQQPGFASVPAVATAGQGAAQFVVITRGDRDFAISGRDKRAADIYKNLAPGDTCVYATSGMARLILKANGTIALITTDTNSDSGRTMYLSMSPKGPSGDPEIRLETPFFKAWVDGSGLHLLDRSGAQVDFGSVGGVPSPFSAISSFFKVTAAVVKIAGAATMIGKGPAYQQAGLAPNPGPVAPGSSTGSGSVAISI